MIDLLIDKIKRQKSPICVGLDTRLEYLPEDFCKKGKDNLSFAAEQILRFNKIIIDATADLIPCVKVQSAYYEMYGFEGVKAFAETLRYAKQKNLIVIADVKRGDIGATANAYAAAYLGSTDVYGKNCIAFEADFITVNAYLGTDGIEPFLKEAKKYDKGLFILVKTSNPSSGELQDLKTVNGNTIYHHMAELTVEWGKNFIGKSGYSDVGAVVGATYPIQAAELRNTYPHLFMLIPGYGAQGATVENLIPFFDKNGVGGIVNNSRGILTAYRNVKYSELDFAEAARTAVIDMREDILSAFFKNGINY